jgi:hypothetical protein
MAPDTWLPQIVLAVALIAALVRTIRGQVFVPIVEAPPARRALPAPREDEEEEQPAEPVRPRFRWHFLPAMVVLTAAVRLAFLVALHR